MCFLVYLRATAFDDCFMLGSSKPSILRQANVPIDDISQTPSRNSIEDTRSDNGKTTKNPTSNSNKIIGMEL